MKTIYGGGSSNAACIPSAVKVSEEVLGRTQLEALATAASTHTRSLPQISPEAGLASVLTSEFGDAFSGAVAALTDQPHFF